jgi:hypothetical protein
MESLSRSWRRFKKSVKEFHTKKPHIEFFTALLTVPVLLTVIILNINNLKGDEKEPEKEPETNQTIVITQPGSNETEKEVIITKEACEPGIGEVSIGFPEEGEEVNDNPVMIDVDYEANGYCAVVWSYRVNGGAWSSYDDTSISLYNLPNGNVKLDLRVKSVVNSDTDSLSRNFVYSGAAQSPTPSSTVTPTPSQ